jgi:Fur family ferric uptake transcriptional regulator
MSLATVYRNLELLAEMGEIQKLDSGGKESRFDGNAKQHHHVRCVQCGRVDDVKSTPLELSPDLEQATGGYHVIGYCLEFTGICPQCKSPTRADDGEATEAGHAATETT